MTRPIKSVAIRWKRKRERELAFVVSCQLSRGNQWQEVEYCAGLGWGRNRLFEHRKLELFGDEEHGEAISLRSTLRVPRHAHWSVAPAFTKDFMDIADGMAALRDAIPVDWWLVVSWRRQHTGHISLRPNQSENSILAHYLVLIPSTPRCPMIVRREETGRYRVSSSRRPRTCRTLPRQSVRLSH